MNFGYPLVPCDEVETASVLAEGICYTRHDTPTHVPGAETTCHTLGGYPATIHSQLQNDAISTLPIESPSWIGINSTIIMGTWRWHTGEVLTYSNWIAGQPAICPSGGAGGLILPDGTWTSACVEEGHPFICEIPPWLVDERTGHGYRLFWAVGTSFSAAAACRFFGGYLATITSAQEQAFVAQTVGMEVWIGASDVDGTGFGWDNAEPFAFTAWALGEPVGSGCVFVDPNQQWHADSCSGTRMALCERE